MVFEASRLVRYAPSAGRDQSSPYGELIVPNPA